MSRQTPSQRLLARLKAMGVPIEDDAVIVRTYAGYWQRAQGAYVWAVEASGHRLPKVTVGSHCRVTDLIRAPRLVATWNKITTDWSIDPYIETADYDMRRFNITELIEDER